MLSALFRELRPYQWLKNVVVFAALVFAQQLAAVEQLMRSLGAFAVLCAASSAMYVLNDIMDVEQDRAHPAKCKRPLASGALGIPAALATMAALVLASLVGAFLLRPQFFVATLVYMILILLYSVLLKNIMIVDVMTVALGFVIRAMAGAIVLDVVFSNWLVVCTLFLALFLSVGKRRHEISLMAEEAVNHRRVLQHYTVEFLDTLIMITAAASLLTYTIYTCSPEVTMRLGTDKLYLSIPFVVYGLFRYLHLVHHRRGGGDPSQALIKDGPLAVTVLLWGVTCVAVLYEGTIR